MYIVHIGSRMYVELVLYMETWTWLYSILHLLQPYIVRKLIET